MYYRRLVLVTVLLGVAAMAGCVKTPDGLKMAEKTEDVADKTAVVIETVVPIVSPYADIVPYARPILIALAAAAATYLKVRPYIVATREIVGKIQDAKKMGDKTSSGAGTLLRDTFADNTAATKKVVAKIKKTL